MREQENAAVFGELACRPFSIQHPSPEDSGTFLPLLEMNSQIFMAVLLLVGGTSSHAGTFDRDR